LGLSLAIVIFGGAFVNKASADVSIGVAQGGGNVSIDSSSLATSSAWTTLTGPAITEGEPGNIAIGAHSLTLPAGWEFNTAQDVTINIGGGTTLSLLSPTSTPSATTISFTVSATSTISTGVLSFSNIQVRPTGTATSTGYMVQHTGVIAGVTNDITGFGQLTTVVGTVAKLSITTDPSVSTVYGSVFAQQPVVKTADQFSNLSVTGLDASKIVTLTLTTGTGTLQGSSTMDIGTGGGNGTVTFVGLTVGATSAVGAGKKLTASAPSLASSSESAAFAITAKTLTVSATGIDKVYNATTTAAVTLSTDKLGSDDVTATSTSATFSTKNIGTSTLITVSGISISGADATNYTLNGVTTATTTATISALAISVTAQNANKTYDATSSTAVLPTVGALQTGDILTATGTEAFSDKNVGVGKTVTPFGTTIDDNNSGNNYSITYATTTSDITPIQLTIANPALTTSKSYDGNTSAAVTAGALSGVVSPDDVTATAAANYDTAAVATGKNITVVYTLSGADAPNYTKPGNYTVAYGVISTNGGGGGGGGGSSTTYCTAVTYAYWQNTCFNNIQYRNASTQTPSGCSLTSAQQLEAQRTCQTGTSIPPVIPPVNPPTAPSGDTVLGNIATESGITGSNNRDTLLASFGYTADTAVEQASLIKYKTILGLDKTLTAAEKAMINYFIVYGTPGTHRLGAGERAAVINSYFQAYGKLPNSEAEWSDVLKIASGRWPSERNAAAEARAKVEFKKVYARNAVMTNNIDENAIMVIAYGLLPLNRNLNSEKVAIKTFFWAYGHNPVSALAWNIVRAIAYSGAKR